MCMWTLEIPGWQPTPLNRLIGYHWATRSKRKVHDAEIVGRAVKVYGIPPATTKRRVSLLVVLPKGKRATDPDSLWKSLLDSLVHAGALKNDSPAWVELAPVRWARGEALETFITLEDMR